LPSAVICWLLVSWLCSGLVTHPVGSPMSHSTKAGAGRGPSARFRSAGAGAVLPVMCCHRAMAGP
jgi:hypothetical protein